MKPRVALLKHISSLVGAALTINDPRDGWPAIAGIETRMGTVPLALFASKVILSGRGRDAHERRLENPGENRPIIVPPSTVPLVLGLWGSDKHVPVSIPLLVAADAWKREGNVTRFSIFVSLQGLQQAMQTGWDRRPNAKGEAITCFQPSRLREHVEAILIDAARHPQIGRFPIQVIPTVPGEPEQERARRAAMRLVREARFGAQVVAAYGERCALCELDLGLVQGAHIYPAAAGDSPDEISNGISLCANHHVAFDRHYIHVDPLSRNVKLHPWLRDRAEGHATCEAFVRSTRSTLAEPVSAVSRPSADMFERRYGFFDGSYEWALSAPAHQSHLAR